MPEALLAAQTAAPAAAVRAAAFDAGATVAEFPINELALAKESFPEFRERLKARLGAEIFDAWCARMNLETMKGTNLVFSVPTTFLRNWLQTHYAAKILACWQELHPSVLRVDVIVRSPSAKPPIKPPVQIETKRPLPSRIAASDKPAQPEGELSGSKLDPRLTFDSFAVGKSNKLAHAAALLIAEGTDCPNPLYVHGQVGLGKSHLLQAIAQSKRSATLYVTAEHFIYSFTASIKSNSPEFKNALRSIDTLLIDDIQFLKNKNTVSDLALIVNSLIDSGRQVVIAGDRQPANLDDIDDRLKSRLMGGMCVEIASPEEETRRGILENRMRHMQLKAPEFVVPPEALDRLAATLPSNGRDLEGALNQLMLHVKVEGSPITAEIADGVVQQMLQNRPAPRIKIEDIQKVCARHFQISKDDMISSRRTAQVVRPRQIAIYICKLKTLRSLPEIGRRFGGRDHTTILHAVRKIEGMVKTCTQTAKDVEEICALLDAA